MPVQKYEERYQGDNNPLRIKLTEADGNAISLSSYSIAFYKHDGTFVESFNSTDNPTLFSFASNVLSFVWEVDAAKYPAGKYYAVWTWVTDTSPAETYKKQVEIVVHAAPDLT